MRGDFLWAGRNARLLSQDPNRSSIIESFIIVFGMLGLLCFSQSRFWYLWEFASTILWVAWAAWPSRPEEGRINWCQIHHINGSKRWKAVWGRLGPRELKFHFFLILWRSLEKVLELEEFHWLSASGTSTLCVKTRSCHTWQLVPTPLAIILLGLSKSSRWKSEWRALESVRFMHDSFIPVQCVSLIIEFDGSTIQNSEFWKSPRGDVSAVRRSRPKHLRGCCSGR